MSGYNYSVEKGEFALLNKDGTYPSPSDWTHTKRKTGEVVNHKGGLICGTGPFDLSGLAGDDLKITPIYGAQVLAPVTVNLTSVVSKAATTVTEIQTALALALTALNFTVSKTTVGVDYDAVYLKIVDKIVDGSKLPWYAPFGCSGRMAEILGVVGWVQTGDLRSSGVEPDTTTGDSVTQTSGTGTKCTIKEPDQVTGKTLTLSLASDIDAIRAMILGDEYDPTTGTYFDRDNDVEAPVFAYRTWIRRYAEGDNVKAGQSEMMVRSFPACSATPGGTTDEEATFSTTEITASCASNSKSAMPSEFSQKITVTAYKTFVAA